MSTFASVRAAPSRIRSWAAAASCAALSCAALLATPAAATTLDLSHFVLTFEDTFRYLDVSAHGPNTQWIAHTPWNGDFGDAAFDDPGPLGPFAASREGLTITARQESDGRWHSGLLSSMDKDGPGQHGFAQRYGYFEIRTKLPDGPGVWPAFWLIGTDKQKSSAEIDVFEYYGAFPNGFHSVEHIWEAGKDRLHLDHITDVSPNFFTSRFNTFGVLIDPERTRFYLNREEIWDTPTPPEYRQPMYVLLNLALGGGWPIDKLVSPAVMSVDYVRVWKDTTLPVTAAAP